MPSRSRTASTTGVEPMGSSFSGGPGGGGSMSMSYLGARKLLRTLSTVSIHESVEGLTGGLAAMGPIGQAIMEKRETAADAPASEMPADFDRAGREVEYGPRTGNTGPGTGDGEEGKTARSAMSAGLKGAHGTEATPISAPASAATPEKASTPTSTKESKDETSGGGGGSGSGSGTPMSNKKKEKRFIIFYT